MNVKMVIAGHEVALVVEAETPADKALLGVLGGNGTLVARVDVSGPDYRVCDRARLIVKLEQPPEAQRERAP